PPRHTLSLHDALPIWTVPPGTVPKTVPKLAAESRASAPRPLAGFLAEAGADRVLQHVEAARIEVVVSIDHIHGVAPAVHVPAAIDRKSTRLNSSHRTI